MHGQSDLLYHPDYLTKQPYNTVAISMADIAKIIDFIRIKQKTSPQPYPELKLQRLLTSSEKNVYSVIAKAMELFSRDETIKGIQYLQEQSKSLEHPKIFDLIADRYRFLEDYPNEIKWIVKTWKYYERNGKAIPAYVYLALAESNERRKNYKRAIEFYEAGREWAVQETNKNDRYTDYSLMTYLKI